MPLLYSTDSIPLLYSTGSIPIAIVLRHVAIERCSRLPQCSRNVVEKLDEEGRNATARDQSGAETGDSETGARRGRQERYSQRPIWS